MMKQIMIIVEDFQINGRQKTRNSKRSITYDWKYGRLGFGFTGQERLSNVSAKISDHLNDSNEAL